MVADSQPLAVLVMGPTAAGKTELAIELKEALDGELVSVDSAMVYRGMDIGTAKPDAATLARAPHRLIDICDPAKPYSAADFREDALAAMDDIVAAGRTPILVGGTMLYFAALCTGMADMPPASPGIREALAARLDREGADALHRELAAVDPEAAQRMHPNNRQRLIRALEVYQVAGRPISSLWKRNDHPAATVSYRILPVVLAPPQRVDLHERIRQRFLGMLSEGLIQEVERLQCRGDLSPALPSIRAVGYRQTWEYLNGKTSYSEMVDRALAATRQLAKRQLTWLRRWSGSHWIPSGDPYCLEKALKIIETGATLGNGLRNPADIQSAGPVQNPGAQGRRHT